MANAVIQINVLDAIGNEFLINLALPPGQAAAANSTPVVIANNQTPLPLQGLATGTNSIGNVSITTLPALPAGTSLLGNVSISALPGLASGANTIGGVTTRADATIGAGAAPSNAFIVGGIYNTLIPSPSSGQTLALQLDSDGRLLTNTEISFTGIGTGTNSIGNVSVTTITLPGLSAGANAIGSVNAVGSAISNTVPLGGPVQIGGIYNATQPTITSTFIVPLQSTTRGGLIVSTGADVFSATINAGLPTGANVIGNVSVSSITLPGLSTGANTIGRVQTNADAPIGVGTAPGKSLVVGAIYNTSAPAPTDGQSVALQVDAGGQLRVNAAVTLGGLSTSANNIGIVNTYADALIGVGTAPLKALAIAGQYNTVLPSPTAAQTVGLQVDASGRLITNTSISIDGIGLASGANVIGLVNTNADASIAPGTAPAKAFITGGVYNTSPPAPTNGQTLAFQLDSAGKLLTNTAVNLGGLATGANVIGTVNCSGMAGSNVAFSGNPVWTGGVYNATQPTINSLCIAPTQMTTRGGLIVSTGVDTFNATISSGLPTGANVIGNVSVSSITLPGLSTGANNIGIVTCVLPGLSTGANVIGTANVSGLAGSNVAFSGNPVWVSGVYNATQPTINSLCIAPAQMTTRGGLIVSTGVDAFLVNTNAEALIGAGTAPAKCEIVGGVYNSSAPAPTNGQTVGLQLDAAGRLITNTVVSVGFSRNAIEMIPTVTAGSYTAGFVMGGIITFANILPAGLTATLETIVLKFKGSLQTSEFDVGIFTTSPSGTFADHGAPAIASGDTAYLLGIYRMVAFQSCFGTHTMYALNGLETEISGATQSLFAVVITKSIPVNPASTTDMSLRLGVLS